MRYDVLAQQWHNGDMMDGGGWFWGVLMMAILLLAVVAIVWLIVRTTHPTSGTAHPGSDANFRAREVLGLRLANGEITPAEYQELIGHLRG